MIDRPRPTRRAATLLAALALLTSTGCSTGRSEMPNTITIGQAEQRVKDYAQQVARELPGAPRLDPIAGGLLSTECLDPDDGGPPGRFTAAASYFLDGVGPSAIADVRRAFHQHLSSRGFTVRTDQADFLVLQNPADGFRVSLQEGGRPEERGLSLTASSPCVWPDGAEPGR